ncbi:flagellar export protein FliJ [Buchnera aphidicola]|uniref:Flagellar FliJ protein n=1 Tax=Buchnera aphidicola (Artemisaphis artemisicola) TaxID=1241836 RepID=A0A4D6XLX9_9GAMM|nr:flagellar FliJ family protein [Buchnera aphidicola]QCI15770.1 flagellar export protein FliJ [Buchnera aphidicola (Artemisaphis artemisicola)]
MKYKKNVFSILKKIQTQKIEKKIIDIKNLYMKREQYNEQQNLLNKYKEEYMFNMNNNLISGMYVYKWNNYNNFILKLNLNIKRNINLIQKNEKKIQENLNSWFLNKKKLKTWEYLYNICNKKMLKIKKIKEHTLYDNYFQLKFFKKGS